MYLGLTSVFCYYIAALLCKHVIVEPFNLLNISNKMECFHYKDEWVKGSKAFERMLGSSFSVRISV